ncbi:MAG: MFS transporter [Candidatus Bipolaricaulia bacterium]
MTRPSKLMNRHFLLIWQGQSVSQMGSQAFAIAMMLWIKHATDSATLMGTLMMASSLPAVILGPIGGTFADRHSRRKIVIFSDVLSGIAVLSLAGLLFLAPDTLEMSIVWLFLVAVSLAVVSSFFRPAIAAAIPDLVPEDKIAAANSLNQFSIQFSMFIGQGTGGVLFRLLGAPVMFLIDGLTYLFSAFSESFIDIPQVIPEKSNQWREKFAEFKQDTVEGFHYIWGRTGLKILFLAAAFVNFFSIPISVLLPFYVEDFLKVSTDWYGFLLAAFGVGAVIGYLLAGLIKLPGKLRSHLMMMALLGESITLGSLGVVNPAHIPITVILILMMVVGAINGFLAINFITVLQIAIPSEIRGRVFGLLGTLSGSISPIAMGLSGVVADLLNQNIPLIYAICGGFMALLTIMVSISREFRDFLAYEPVDKQPSVIPG